MVADTRVQPQRPGLGLIVSVAFLWVGAVAHAEDWYILCAPRSGEVVASSIADRAGFVKIGGPFPGQQTAAIWIEENCPRQRCDMLGACVSGAPKVFPAGSWIPICSPAQGDVAVMQAPLPPGVVPLEAGDSGVSPQTDAAGARAQIASLCPSWRCDSRGRCARPSGPSTGPASLGDSARGREPAGETGNLGGWVVGELSSVHHGPQTSTSQASPEPSRALKVPETSDGSDLLPVVHAARAAAAACSYPAALATADQLATFDPQHPWLVANRDLLRRLAARQRATEMAVWKASAALSLGDLKEARELARSAADTAVNCQNQAVSQLLAGINLALDQKSRQQRAASSQAAAGLLPSLIGLAQVMGGRQGSGVTLPPPTISGVPTAVPLSVMNPCAFKYEYRDKSSFVPVCTCAGYAFDPRTFQCAAR